jgi:hypothetical protein
MEAAMRMIKILSWIKTICFLLLAVMLTAVILLLSVPLNLVTDDQTLCEIDHSQRNIVLFFLAFASLYMFPYIMVYRKEACQFLLKILKIKKKGGG